MDFPIHSSHFPVNHPADMFYYNIPTSIIVKFYDSVHSITITYTVR